MCRAYMDGYGYNGIANVGVRPTVSNEEKVWLETFLFDYDADAYGKEVMVELIEFVRPEQKFENKEELKARRIKISPAADSILKFKHSNLSIKLVLYKIKYI